VAEAVVPYRKILLGLLALLCYVSTLPVISKLILTYLKSVIYIYIYIFFFFQMFWMSQNQYFII